MDSTGQVTGLLHLAGAGDPAAAAAVFPLVYDELRQLARRQLQREVDGHSLNTTALVHEAYLKLVDQRRSQVKNRAHFFAIAATAMRRILVDHARRHGAAKRGAGAKRVPLEMVDGLAAEERADLLVALDAALTQLAALDARQAKVVECRFFGGLTEEETAQALGTSPRTVKRDWAKARSWLYQALYPEVAG
jgi:RNA polymerase sigma factor (TIGR02999 family)